MAALLQLGQGLLAFPAAVVVARAREGVPDHAVDDHDMGAVQLQRGILIFQGLGIQEDGVIS